MYIYVRVYIYTILVPCKLTSPHVFNDPLAGSCWLAGLLFLRSLGSIGGMRIEPTKNHDSMGIERKKLALTN